MPPTDLDALLGELRPDRSGGAATHVALALTEAYDLLQEAAAGGGSQAVDRAAEQVTQAIEALQLCRARLDELAGDLESIEHAIAALDLGVFPFDAGGGLEDLSS